MVSLRTVVLLCIVGFAAAQNNRPIIGILTLPNSLSSYQSEGSQYFAASYVKWLEAGGARVVPVRYTLPQEEMVDLLHSLNGVLFTGGGVDFFNGDGTLTEFGAAGKTIVDTVVDMNKKGIHFPLWGTCLGFQLLNVMAAGANDTLLRTGFDSENLTLPLTYAQGGQTSRMMAAAGADIVNILTNQPVTMNNHHAGVTPEDWMSNPVLPHMFQLISTNKGREGNEFVSTIEGLQVPMYATQWHPEKVSFEWNPDECMNHDFDSVKVNLFFARFFVGEAHKNNNAFPSIEAATTASIYQYSPVYTFPHETSFEQCYFFNP